MAGDHLFPSSLDKILMGFSGLFINASNSFFTHYHRLLINESFSRVSCQRQNVQNFEIFEEKTRKNRSLIEEEATFHFEWNPQTVAWQGI